MTTPPPLGCCFYCGLVTGHKPSCRQNTLDLNVVVSDGEDLDKVARELIGIKGQAIHTVLGYLPGDQWPTIRFIGTVHQLATIQAKSEGSPIGRPRR